MMHDTDPQFTDHTSLIDALGGMTKVGKTIADCTPGRVSQWKMNNRIPPEAWDGIVEMAQAEGVGGVTIEWLHSTLPARKKPASSTSKAVA